jgi:hypothetical protein
MHVKTPEWFEQTLKTGFGQFTSWRELVTLETSSSERALSNVTACNHSRQCAFKGHFRMLQIAFGDKRNR